MADKIDYSNVDYNGFKQMMIQGLKDTMPEYTDTSETDPGVIIIELLARGLDILSYYQNVQANECFLATAERRENVLNWSSMLGYTPKTCTPSVHTEVIAITDLNVNVPKGTVLKTKVSNISEQPIYFTTMQDLVQQNTLGEYTSLIGYELNDGTLVDSLDNIEQSIKNYLFRVPVIHGTWVNNELLGSSTGSENMVFTLKSTPVSVDNLTITTIEDGSIVEWKRVNNFVESGIRDNHYTVTVLENDSVQIVFGDGRTGRIPLNHSEIYATYLNGGGTVGNVGKYTITELQTTISGVSYVYNVERESTYALPTDSLGTNKETIKSIKTNAPSHKKTVWGCVTVKDYADKLLELFPQIEVADSSKTSLTDSTDNNAIDGVDVFYAMRDENNNLVDGTLYASQNTKAKIEAMYEERQLVGTHVNFKPTTFLGLKLKAIMYTLDGMGSSDEDVQVYNNTMQEVKDYLTYFFKQSTLGYNTPLSLVDVEAAVVSKVSNVRSFRIYEVKCNGLPNLDTSEILIPCEHGQIITLDSVDISKRSGV